MTFVNAEIDLYNLQVRAVVYTYILRVAVPTPGSSYVYTATPNQPHLALTTLPTNNNDNH